MDKIIKGLLFVLLVCAGTLARAGETTHARPIPKSGIVAGQVYTMTDPTWADEVANPGEFAVLRENQVRLIYSRDSLSDVDGSDWTLRVDYTITFTGMAQPPVNGRLEIGHTASLHDYAAAEVFRPGSHSFKVKITGVTWGGTSPDPDDIHLELITVTERYRRLDVAQQPILTFNATTHVLSWTHVPGAEEYDLEWAWVDAQSSLDSAGAFRRAVRLNIPGHYYLPQLNYREGILWFRVRAVGRHIDGVGIDYTHRRPGAWSDAVSDTVDAGGSFEADRNLTWTSTFAEDGKFKKVVSYVDGAGKTRQSVTHLSSDSTSVIVQTEYDHEGRGVLTTIPIPVAGIDLGYRDLVNTRSSGSGTVAYSPDAFDDIGQTLPMANGSGAALYFSSANNLGGIHRDYIPDAGGYPFTETEFKRDATGRVARQSGVGPDHKLGSGHETRFFYGDASALDLYRMFGGNVGDASHYLMKMSVDPNGQVSLAWQDQEERVVATALAGDAPGNLVALDSLPTDTLIEDLMPNNFLDLANGESRAHRTFLNEVPNKLYSFYYAFAGPDVTLDCICKECAYTLEITVRDPWGQLVELDSAGAGPSDTILSFAFPQGGQGCPDAFYTHEMRFSANFGAIGDYRLEKVLRAVPLDVDSLRAEVDSCPGFPDLQDIIDDYIANVDTSVCDVDCYSLVPIWISPDTLPAHVIGQDTLDSLCNGAFYITGADIARTECGSIYRQMWNAYAPGGWLYDSLVWAGLAGDSTRIDSLVRTHREWCHYSQCLADTGSRRFDIVMASLPTYSKALQYGYYPANPASLVDPWFNTVGGSGSGLRSIFLDSLFDDHGHPYMDDPDSAIIRHFHPDNDDLDPAFYASCGGDPNCEDTLRHFYTRAAYMDAKLGLYMQLLEDTLGCHYYQDVHTIVQRPVLPALAGSDMDQYGSFFLAGDCNAACAANVALWVRELTDSCTALTEEDSVALVAALFDYCLGHCPYENPGALILEEHIAAGYLDDVIDILDDHSPCEDYLDSIAVPDPYVYTDSLGDTLWAECTHWDPCFAALVEAVNEHWAYGAFPGEIPLADHPVLQWCHPGDSLIRVTDTSVVLVDTNNAVSCQVLYLVDENGDVLPLDSLKFLRLPVLNPNPAGVAQSFVLGATTFHYQHIEVEATLLNPDSTDRAVQAFVYSSCADSFTVWQDSCLAPVTGVDSAWVVEHDPEAVHDSCVAALVANAVHNATLYWEGLVAHYLDSLLGVYGNACFAFPFREDFEVRHLPLHYQYTLYYYDQAGTLVQTVPPEGVELLGAAAAQDWIDGVADPVADMPAHRMGTRYTYNTLGQPRSSASPDRGTARTWYDSRDQVRLSQDARQDPGNDYAYTRYDALGRVVESGQLENYASALTQSALDDPAFPSRASQTLTDIVAMAYDTATGLNLAAAMNRNLRTRVSAAVREDAEGDTVSVTLYGYDDHGNVAATRTDLRGLGVQNLAYQYELVSANVREVRYQDGHKDFFAHRYSYDADNRLTKVRTSRDDLFWDLDGRYFRYLYGPLARLELGQDNVQGADWMYSIHGFTKGVNMPGDFSGMNEPGRDGDTTSGANPGRWGGRDAFSFHLGFYDGDYDPIGSVGLGSAAAAWADLDDDLLSLPGEGAGLYNGNIALMVTDLNFPAGFSSYAGANYNAMAYQYDQLNRIRQSRSYVRLLAGWTRLTDDEGYFDTDYSYDRNGNIAFLVRWLPRWDGSTWDAVEMDRQEYHYHNRDLAGGLLDNRLTVVRDLRSTTVHNGDIDDQAGGTGGPDVENYRYDAIGNLVQDSSEYIDTILWDLHGKVRAVIRTAEGQDSLLPDLWFWYDGQGRRVRKRVVQPLSGGGADTTDTWYALDPQGNVMAVYVQARDAGGDTLVTSVREFPIWGADRLGMWEGDVVLRRQCTSGCGPLEDVHDPASTHRALMLGEVMYDSPKPRDPFTLAESHEGEYLVVVNHTDLRVPLRHYALEEMVTGDAMRFDTTDTLEPGQRMVVGYGDSVGEFARWAMLPTALRSDSRVALVRAQDSLPLPDKGGMVRLRYLEPGSDSAEVDRMAYGGYHGLAASNADVDATLVDSVDLRDALWSVQRKGFTAGAGHDVYGEGVDRADPLEEPAPLPRPALYGQELSRGRKRYELKNHLGDVLAVVSDLKRGVEIGSADGIVEYYSPDVLRMADYYPFGMEMVNRVFVANGYRYGFNGKEHDDEWCGEGNLYDYGFRIHDPRLGRFLSVDPLAREYPWNSTYAFAEDKPIVGIDLDGLELKTVVLYYELNADNSYSIVHEKTIVHIVQDVSITYEGKKYAMTRVYPHYEQEDGRFYAEAPYNRLEPLEGTSLKPSAAYDFTESGSHEKFANDLDYIANGEGQSPTRRMRTIVARNMLAPENTDLEDLEVLLAAIPPARMGKLVKLSSHGEIIGAVPSSTILARNLQTRGAIRPSNTAAHHIVAGSDPRAATARGILQREGIDINEAANGVFLARGSKYATPPAIPHSRIHTDRYYNTIEQRLLNASPGTVRQELGKIRIEILNGTFPH